MATKKEQGPLESGNRRTLIRSWGWQPCVFTLGHTQTHSPYQYAFADCADFFSVSVCVWLWTRFNPGMFQRPENL